MIPLSPNRMEVTMHTSYEHWHSSGSQTGQYVPYVNSSGHNGDKPRRGLNLNDDVERNVAQEK